MPARPKHRSSIARQIVLSMLLGMLVLLGGLAALLGWIAADLDAALAQQPSIAADWVALQRVALELALPWWPAALAVLLGAMLLVWVLVRRATRPLGQLVTAAATIGSEAAGQPLPVRAAGEVGELARSFEALSQALQRSTHELEQQHRSLSAMVRRLEGLLRIEQELSATVEADQVLRRMATILRSTFGYEWAGVALVDGEVLAYHGCDAEPGAGLAAPRRTPLTEQSIAGRAALTGAPVRVDDLNGAPHDAPAPGLPAARSELAVPVIHTGQLLAMIVVQSSRPAAFGPEDEQQLLALAHPLATALATARYFQAGQLYRQLAAAAYRLSQALTAAPAPGEVPGLLLDQIAQALPEDRGVVVLLDGDYLEIAAAHGFAGPPELVRARMRLADHPLIAEVARQGCALALADTARDPRYRPIAGAPPARSWLGAPLLCQGQAAAVLVLESDRQCGYSEEELHAIATLASHAALAIEHARLAAEVQERTRQLEVVTYVTQVVSTRDVSRELPGILRTIVHQIRRVVPCDRAAIALYNEDDDTFSVETVYDFAVSDWNELPPAQRLPAAHTPWQTACRTAGPLVQPELARSAFAHDQRLASTGLRSGVVVPIIGGNRAVGTLDFASREPAAYGPPQVATLLELSHYLGAALHNARLARDREETAIKLARTQEHLNMVDKVRAVGQLASGVAHDFNNLLAGILGNAQLLLLETQDAEQRELLRIIEQAAKDGAETVRRLQGFARMEHDTPLTEVRLDLLARDAIDLTRPRWRDVAQSRGAAIEIVRQLQPVTPIAGRPAELREVLTNLIINAVDALPRGGTITVSTYDERAADGSNTVVVEVADTGTGMTPEVRARIFDPFFTTKGEQGTGLGLAVSLGIVQSHGGQIEVESEIGCGTRFIIRLPVRVTDQVSKRKEPRAITITPGHILFVESEAMIRDATVRLLSRWGHKVTQAADGTEALRLFMPDLYDVVISDLGMPDMNGWELLAQIKQRDRQVPTVLITGWGRQVSDEEARARGVDFVIEKPFDQDDLRAVLAEAMGAT